MNSCLQMFFGTKFSGMISGTWPDDFEISLKSAKTAAT